MREMERDALLEELSGLSGEVPPMPEDAHAGWMKLVEEEAMAMQQNETTKKTFRIPKAVTRMLATAAALVFVVGGTLLTRDELAPRRSTAAYESPMYKTTSDSSARSGSANGLYAMDNAALGGANVSYEAEYTMEDAAEQPAGVSKQKVIRTASMTLSTREFDDAAARLRELCADMGGWVSYSSQSTSYNGLRNAWFTLRIPSDRLDAFLAGTDGVGRVSSRSESADDVTESYYDTASRLATKQALLNRLLAMATDAADLSDLLELESKIADVQYDIDRLQGSLNHTDSQVNYATVDVTLKEEADADVMQVKDKTLGERMLSALTVGWDAFTEFLGDTAVFVAAALPFVAVLAAIVIAVKVIRKKHRK